MSDAVTEIDLASVFAGDPSALLVLAPDLVVRAANPAYLQAFRVGRHDLVGRHLPEVLPAVVPDEKAAQTLLGSLCRVATSGTPDHVWLPPLNERAADDGGEPAPLLAVSAPVTDSAGELSAIVHRVEAVTAPHPLLEQARTELEQLREALVTRAVIDQAKGIVMARQGVGPDGAFAVLVRESQHRNVKVRQIAAELVATTTAPTLEQ